MSARWLSILLLCGCQELPLESDLEYERPLAIVAEAVDPDGMFAEQDAAVSTLNEFLPGDRGRLQTIVAGPDGLTDEARLDRVWLACLKSPAESEAACFRTGLQQSLDPPLCGELDAMLPGSDAVGQVCRLDVDDDGLLTYPLLMTQAEGRTLAMGSFIGVDRSGWECVEALGGSSHDLPDDCLFATHELPLAPLSLVLPRLEALGIPTAGLAELADAAPPQDRGRNPALGALAVLLWDREGERPVESLDAIHVGEGQRLWFVLAFDEAERQTFFRPRLSGGFDEVTERLDASWFATAGTFDEIREDDLVTKIRWTPPPEPSAEPIHIFAVVRDGRWGTTWLHFETTASRGSGG